MSALTMTRREFNQSASEAKKASLTRRVAEKRNDATQGAVLHAWLDGQVLPQFAGRVLAFDQSVAIRCARLHVPDSRAERDAVIAATALVHGMTVVTRNSDDFKATGVPLLNPWK